MNKLTLIFSLLLQCGITWAQTDLSAWEGHWRGTLAIYNEKGLVQETTMGLNILKDGKEWKWQIIYGEGDSQDFRDYSLRPTSNPSQFELDEHNGIVLRLSYLHHSFHSIFEMNNTTLVVSYSLENDEMVFRTQFSPAEEVITSGGNNENTPIVKARKTTTFQIAHLTKS